MELTKRYKVIADVEIQARFFKNVQVNLILEFLERLKNLPWEATFSVIKCVRDMKKLVTDWQDNVFFMELLDDDSALLDNVLEQYATYENYRALGSIGCIFKKLVSKIKNSK